MTKEEIIKNGFKFSLFGQKVVEEYLEISE